MHSYLEKVHSVHTELWTLITNVIYENRLATYGGSNFNNLSTKKKYYLAVRPVRAKWRRKLWSLFDVWMDLNGGKRPASANKTQQQEEIQWKKKLRKMWNKELEKKAMEKRHIFLLFTLVITNEPPCIAVCVSLACEHFCFVQYSSQLGPLFFFGLFNKNTHTHALLAENHKKNKWMDRKW